MRTSIRNDDFPITRHSVLAAIRSDDPAQRSRATELISTAYWKPIYKYVRLKWNLPREDAQDFTQEFLLRLIEKEFLESFDPEKARLRTFMRTCADRLFLTRSAMHSVRKEIVEVPSHLILMRLSMNLP